MTDSKKQLDTQGTVKKLYGIFRLKNIKHIDIHKKDTAQTQGNMLE